MADSTHSFRVFGLTLDLKINALALVAFLLSLGSLFIQAVQYYRGSEVVMSAGERVNLIRQTHPAKRDLSFLLVNARLDYVNTGAVGRDAIISSERLAVRFGDLPPYEYRWLHFELFVPDDSGGPKIEKTDGAHSFTVPGSGAESHQTTFVAFPGASVRTPGALSSYIRWDAFLRLAEAGPPLILTFLAADRLGHEYVTDCTVNLSGPVLEALHKKQWATALCEAKPDQTAPSSGNSDKSSPASSQPAKKPPPEPR